MQVGPCVSSGNGYEFGIAVINMVQIVLLAWLANRRIAADRRELNGSRQKLDQRKIDGGKLK